MTTTCLRLRAAAIACLCATVTACGTVGTPRPTPGSTTPDAGDDARSRLEAVLTGDYDNHEQARAAAAAARAGKGIAVPRVHESWRELAHTRGDSLWLWHLDSGADSPQPTAQTWLYVVSGQGADVTLTPYRALDPAVAQRASDAPADFRFVAEQWAELAPCAQRGTWQADRFSASTNEAACSALLPGLGGAAALLPLRVELQDEILRTATFADRARGGDASIAARRVRWFTGWAALNGGGPQARAANDDWHLQKDLRLSSEGGTASLRWRDGAASGWHLELERKSYPERKLQVLQLNVVDDASGTVLTYAWSDPTARSIGFNLGWLQVGLTQAP